MGIIQKQGISNTIVTYFGILIGFVNLIVLQPIFLSPEEIGLTRILFSFSSLVSVLIPLGMTNITVRYFPFFRSPENRNHGFFGAMLILPLIGFIIASIALFFAHNFFLAQYSDNSPLFVEYYYHVIPLSFALGLVSVLTVYASSLFKTTFPAFLNDIIARIFLMIIISVYFLQWISFHVFVSAFVGIYCLQLIILFVYILRIDKPSFKPNIPHFKAQNLKEILSYGFIISFAAFSALGLKYIDSILIGKYMALSFVGIYTIAAFIPTVIEAPLNALEKISAPKISQAMADGHMDVVKQIYYKSCRYLFLLGGFIFLCININITALLEFLPPEYSQGINVVFIISLGALLNMAGGSNGSIIFSSDKYKVGALFLILLVGLAFVLNIILIPLYGIEGAAMATSLSILTVSVVRFVFIWLRFHLQPYDFNTIKIAALILLCFLLNKLLPILFPPLGEMIFRTFLVSVMYFTCGYLLKIIPEFHSYLPWIDKAEKK